MKRPTKALLAAAAAAALALTGGACSGGPDATSRTDEAARSEESTSEATVTGREEVQLATAEFRVEGMTCGGCAIATEIAVEKLDGVESADAEFLGEEEGGRCTVTYDSGVVSTDRIDAAIEGAGFAPSLAHGSEGS